MLGDRGSKEIVSLLRTVAAERLATAHFICGPVQRGDGCRWERFGNVADTAADEACGRLWVSVSEGFDSPADFGEQVTRFEFKIMFVQASHRLTLGAGSRCD
jgi:hypothetical protein